jgi:hypothetical protein
LCGNQIRYCHLWTKVTCSISLPRLSAFSRENLFMYEERRSHERRIMYKVSSCVSTFEAIKSESERVRLSKFYFAKIPRKFWYSKILLTRPSLKKFGYVLCLRRMPVCRVCDLSRTAIKRNVLAVLGTSIYTIYTINTDRVNSKMTYTVVPENR